LHWLHVDGGVPGVDFPYDAVYLVLPRRMRIAYDLPANGVVTQLAASGLRPAEEHVPIARLAIQQLRRLSLERSAIDVERDRGATRAGDRLL